MGSKKMKLVFSGWDAWRRKTCFCSCKTKSTQIWCCSFIWHGVSKFGMLWLLFLVFFLIEKQNSLFFFFYIPVGSRWTTYLGKELLSFKRISGLTREVSCFSGFICFVGWWWTTLLQIKSRLVDIWIHLSVSIIYFKFWK